MTAPLELWGADQIRRILQAQVNGAMWEPDDKVRRGRLQVLGNLALVFGVELQVPQVPSIDDPFVIEVET